MSLKKVMFTVPPSLVKFVGSDVPKAMKLTVAKGAVPMPPRDLVLVLFALSREADEEVSRTALESLKKLPTELLRGILSDTNTHPLILDFFARTLPYDSSLQETIALNKATDDETIVYQASLTNKRLVEIISNNQIRLLRCPRIVDVISENPISGTAIIDRILEFVQRETQRKSPQAEAKPEQAGEGMEVEIEEVKEEAPLAPGDDIGVVTIDGEEVESAWQKMSYSDELLRDKSYKSKEEKEEDEKNLYRKIQNMSVAEKIKLAMLGNAQARSILVRDTNKMVATAVLKSGRLTDNEIESISRSPAVSDEVIRLIAQNKEWTKTYQVKLNLINNSKTPVSEAMRFLNFLRDKDLQNVARSRNIPNAVVTAAKKLLQTRQEKSAPKKPAH